MTTLLTLAFLLASSASLAQSNSDQIEPENYSKWTAYFGVGPVFNHKSPKFDSYHSELMRDRPVRGFSLLAEGKYEYQKTQRLVLGVHTFTAKSENKYNGGSLQLNHSRLALQALHSSEIYRYEKWRIGIDVGLQTRIREKMELTAPTGQSDIRLSDASNLLLVRLHGDYSLLDRYSLVLRISIYSYHLPNILELGLNYEI